MVAEDKFMHEKNAILTIARQNGVFVLKIQFARQCFVNFLRNDGCLPVLLQA